MGIYACVYVYMEKNFILTVFIIKLTGMKF